VFFCSYINKKGESEKCEGKNELEKDTNVLIAPLVLACVGLVVVSVAMFVLYRRMYKSKEEMQAELKLLRERKE